MNRFRFLTSGESHGKCLNAIIEGVPAGFRIKASVINEDLARRQVGYGRGGRMQIEKDTVEIKSGVRFGKSTGAPICLEIKNKDFSNWEDVMNVEQQDYPTQETLKKPLSLKYKDALISAFVLFQTLPLELANKSTRAENQELMVTGSCQG